jgi:lysozyme
MVNWNECYKLWRKFEGLRLEAYPDPATGNEPWTIGYGHTGGLSAPQVKKGMVITKPKAEEYMKNDLEAAYKALEKLIKVDLNPNQWAALISFYGNLKTKTFLSSSVLRFINENKLDEVPGRMALYRLGAGKVMPGLVRRRSAEGTLWMLPEATMENSPKETVVVENKEVQGVEVKPANTKKPWDWGIFGIIITTFAGLSDEVKKIVADITSAFGIPPLYLLAAVVVGFGGWTIYSKWRDR